MADPGKDAAAIEASSSQAQIASFEIEGLFGDLDRKIQFPPYGSDGPAVLIMSGPNGTGKTTVLRMIAGVLELDFDEFRRIPFKNAALILSNGERVSVTSTKDKRFPLKVAFRDVEVKLLASNDTPELYTEAQREAIFDFRRMALPVLKTISFQLLDISRTRVPTDDELLQLEMKSRNTRHRGGEAILEPLSKRVKTFMAEAQVNYRKFFAATELALLPRLIERLKAPAETSPADLHARLDAIRSALGDQRRFGLQTEEDDLNALSSLLDSEAAKHPYGLGVIETYVEVQERRHRERELIVNRLVEFERIVDEFLVGKAVRLDAQTGLRIENADTKLRERDLSSGENNFLYMMVTALLCHRTGSVIAIDEPELSLHVTWQRRLVNALARCASGASPLFVFATHSIAIAAEHEQHEIRFASLE